MRNASITSLTDSPRRALNLVTGGLLTADSGAVSPFAVSPAITLVIALSMPLLAVAAESAALLLKPAGMMTCGGDGLAGLNALKPIVANLIRMMCSVIGVRRKTPGRSKPFVVAGMG